MKCRACNYEKDWQWGEKGERVEIGDKKFIHIEGSIFQIKCDDGWRKQGVQLYACPECSTVQMVKD